MKLYRQKYAGFGPTLASEKLCEDDPVVVLADASAHDWLEGRGPMLTLVGKITPQGTLAPKQNVADYAPLHEHPPAVTCG